MLTQPYRGKALTVCGPVEPSALGRVSMHEHLYCDWIDEVTGELIQEEKPLTPERREYMMKEAVPYLKQCAVGGGYTMLDVTMAPLRAWPPLYPEIAAAANIQIVLCTGFYREIELGTYWATTPERAIWPYVRKAAVEELAEFCIREIVDGLHGTTVHAGAIKLGSSQPAMTAAEEKTFRAGARAQKATGVHITTHCTRIGAETSQLKILDAEGVDLRRVVIGHTAKHLMEADCRQVCLEWMRRGANFLPTNLGISRDDGECWRPLVDAIHAIFDAGYGDRLSFGLDWAYCSGGGMTKDNRFGPCTFIPPPPFLHIFSHTLPAFRRMGLTAEEEDWIMRRNPQRIIPVQ